MMVSDVGNTEKRYIHMEGLIVLLLLMLVALTTGGLYLMYVRKEGPSSGPPVNISAGSVVNVRSAGSKAYLTLAFDVSDIANNEPVPFMSDIEPDPFDEQDLIERFRDSRTPETERAAIAGALRSRGYSVTYADGPTASSAGTDTGAPSDEGVAPDADIAAETDEGFLEGLLTSPYVGEERKEAARRRLAELRERNEEDGFIEGYVDPLTLLDIGDPHPDIPYEPISDVQPQAPEDEDPTDLDGPTDDGAADVIEFTMTGPDMDDDVDSRKAIGLMTFIARSFRKGLLSPELVAFAQDRLNLKVNEDFWSDEQRLRAARRKEEYLRDPAMAAMPLDKFEIHVRNAVESAERAAGAAPARGIDWNDDPVWKRLEREAGILP